MLLPDEISNAISFSYTIGVIGLSVLCVYCGMLSLWEKHIIKHGLYVTYNPFNGTQWDGFPFKSLDESRFRENVTWMIDALKKPRIVCLHPNTDYTVWDVLTWNGIKRAEPGDVIAKTIFGYKVIKNFKLKKLYESNV